jgi:hypothetical protein
MGGNCGFKDEPAYDHPIVDKYFNTDIHLYKYEYPNTEQNSYIVEHSNADSLCDQYRNSNSNPYRDS